MNKQLTESFLARLRAHPQHLVFNRGIEREALRVTESGGLASTPHPEALGSKLTHPKITTDFSEAQLELITPVHQTPEAALADLDSVHRHIYSVLENEILWSSSMPCVLADDNSIPLAYYGESNLGRLKTTYRNGLGYRYGRSMQTICAVHYNFSFAESFWQWLHQEEESNEALQDFQSRRYFDLMRNFRRYSWLLLYLFGASPAVCNSFVAGKAHSLESWGEGTSYLPHATSLRSGNLGYQSDTQAEHMNICYNSLPDYVQTLASAICEPFAGYADIGALVEDEYRQVNTNILQSEAEFYSSIRAKRVPPSGENFLECLKTGGVQYIEVRLLDVNPYLPLGINAEEIRFLDTFLLFCLLHDSPRHDEQLCREVKENQVATVLNGRASDLLLTDAGKSRTFSEWARVLVTEMVSVANLLDACSDDNDNHHSASIRQMQARIDDASLTPSGQILKDLADQQVPFFRFAMNQALKHRDEFMANPLNAEDAEAFVQMARQSREDHAAIEAASGLAFDDYLQQIADSYQPLLK